MMGEFETHYVWGMDPGEGHDMMPLPFDAIMELTNHPLETLGGKSLMEYIASLNEDED